MNHANIMHAVEHAELVVAPGVTTRRGRCGGRPCIQGTRMDIASIARWLEGGASVTEIKRQYPHLTRTQITAAIAFIAAEWLKTEKRRRR
jgi:uncharacterized protein (DUF433 family)